MLCTVASDGAEGAIVHTEWDIETNNCLARLNQVQVLLVDASFCSCVVEVEFDLFEEARLTVFIETGSDSSEVLGETSLHYKKRKFGVRSLLERLCLRIARESI